MVLILCERRLALEEDLPVSSSYQGAKRCKIGLTIFCMETVIFRTGDNLVTKLSEECYV